MDILDIKKILKEQLGITYLLPHQELLITHIVGNEVNHKKTRLLAALPTGSGKSICFMAPAVLLEGAMVCVYPLLSLMADQARRMEEMGLNTAVFKGGMTKEERTNLTDLVVGGKIKVIVTNMEMLLFLSQNNEYRRLWDKVTTLVLDEVHTAISWGNSFRTSYQSLPSVLDVIRPRHILAFTATMDRFTTHEIVERVFLGKHPYIVKASSDRPNIYYHAVRSLNRDEDMLNIAKKSEFRPCVIFCNSRKETERIATKFIKRGFDALYYHAGLSKEERKTKEEYFYNSSNAILVATSAYGMGVDKKNIRCTIHTFLPASAEDYLQESGRAGRDGGNAHSFVLWKRKDESLLKDVFSSSRCIRHAILEMMDEKSEEESCFQCSHCIDDGYVPKGEKAILSLLSMHPYRRRKKVVEKLKTNTLTNPFPPLLLWDYREIYGAMNDLEEEGLIKGGKTWIRLTHLGKKRLLYIKSKK